MCVVCTYNFRKVYISSFGRRRLFADAVRRSEIGRGKGNSERDDSGHVTATTLLVQRGDAREGMTLREGRRWRGWGGREATAEDVNRTDRHSRRAQARRKGSVDGAWGHDLDGGRGLYRGGGRVKC